MATSSVTSSSTTASTATTTATSTASTGSQILTSLGAGSGIDTASLVSSLVAAQQSPRDSALKTKEDANTAKISALGTLSQGVDAFSSSLKSLIDGGSLRTQATSSDTGILTATARAGSRLSGLSARIEVRQLAQAQTLVSPPVSSVSAPIGLGELTLTSSLGTSTITIDSSNNSLVGLAQAINKSALNVTASIVQDATGSRLTLKGDTGAAGEFTLTAAPGADAGLVRFTNASTGMTASGTTVASPALADATTAKVGQGSFALSYGGQTATVTIDASNDNLDGMAAAINAKGLGITASVQTDATGSRLVMSDGSGSGPAFTLTPAADAQAGLSRFAYGTAPTTMTQAQAAQNAILQMDGVTLTRSTNVITDVIDGVSLTLNKAAVGTSVAIGSTPPTDAIKQAVTDFVTAYNELKTQLDKDLSAGSGGGARGALYGNPAARAMQRQLGGMTSTVLASGSPGTLAEIGVSTQNDGTLTVNETKLKAALANNPAGVEALFNPTQVSSSPLIRITNTMGNAKAGTYKLSDIKAATDSASASGKIEGAVGFGQGNLLLAARTTGAVGLSVEVLGDVPAATVTVELGLGGALQAIRDSLLATKGPVATANEQLSDEKDLLATQRAKLTDSMTAYRDKLTNTYSAMETRMAAIKATQSYLTQQIALWTNEDNS